MRDFKELNGLNRREFLKLSAAGLGGLALPSWLHPTGASPNLPEFPQHKWLGRVAAGTVELKAKPDSDSQTLGELYEDTVVAWLREVVGRRLMWLSQRWVETPDGYIYASNLQPVRNHPNAVLTSLPDSAGMWVEVSVPYADLVLANPPARSPWLKNVTHPRVYYSQILWVDQIRTDENNQVWYRVNERYGSYGDIFWIPGEALRPLTAEELTPIHPEAENKWVEVDVTNQTMACYEGEREVYFCRVSTGVNVNKEWSTPVGPHHIWRKLISLHMSGGTTGGGWDLPGIGWTSLFAGNGVAIHSTFWHNSYGVATSHGCVNATPEDSKWVWRWTMPVAPLDTGDITVSGTTGSKVVVVES